MQEVDKHARAAEEPDTAPGGIPAVGGKTGEQQSPQILPGQHFERLPLDLVAPAPEGQARQDFDEERLLALAESLKRSGVREPIIVTPHGAEPGHFQIVAGERRWRAAKLAGLIEIPCIVDAGLVERRDKLLAQAEENLHRENLNAVEEAAVLAQIMEARGVDVGQAGELLGKSLRQARRLLQLHKAPAPIKRAVARGQLDARAAVELVRVHTRYLREDETPSGSKALQRIDSLVDRFVREEWSVRKLEQFAARLEAKDGTPRTEVKADGAAPTRAASVEARQGRAPSRKAKRPAIKRKGDSLRIDVGRIERHELSPEERAALIALFEDLLFKTRRA